MAWSVVVFGIVGLWVAPVLIAMNLTEDRGRGSRPGLLLGLFLGWIGVVIAACLSPIGPSPFAAYRGTPTRTCPYCAEEIKPAAVVCRWCGRDLP